ncbi:MAG: LysR family transcriptional regulator [Sedimentibacter sp.]
MNYSNIETFLTLAKTKSFTKTAETLYLSQSTISYRLKSLEDELGVKLIQREQGKGYITLTAKGEEFIDIANKWNSLLKDTQEWKTQNPVHKLKIGSVDSLNTCVFSKLYKKLLLNDSPIILNVSTHWTETIHKLIENYGADIGFVLWQIPSNSIISKPLFSERMVLVSSAYSNFTDIVHPKDLNPQNEVFLYCGPNFKIWHDYWWDNAKREYSSVDTVALMKAFFDITDFWSIVPISIARNLTQNNLIKISELEESPPDRICYEIINKYPLPKNVKSLEAFDELLNDYIKSDDFNSIIK